jgi:hypothetical protein
MSSKDWGERLDGVTRISIVDHRATGDGLIADVWNVQVNIEKQDDGRTLKIWLNDSDEPWVDPDEALARSLVNQLPVVETHLAGALHRLADLMGRSGDGQSG